MECSICCSPSLAEIGIREFFANNSYYKNLKIHICDFKCLDCGHVQSKKFGGSEFLKKLYDSAKLKEQWSPDGLTPYSEIAENTYDFAKSLGSNIEIVYDFGAGDLEVLTEGSEIGLWEKSNSLGLDFNIVNYSGSIPTLSVDLSTSFAKHLLEKTRGQKFDLAFCTHVLEHLEQPKMFLEQVLQLTHSYSVLYLEVPDNANLDTNHIINGNLHGAQHIHFFTLGSLIELATSAGWEILDARNDNFGWMPRSRVLVQPKIKDRSSRQYKFHKDMSRKIGIRFRDQIISATKSDEKVAVWGIGTDFIFNINPDDTLVRNLNGSAVFLDQNLAGKQFGGFNVIDPSELSGFTGKIFCTPFNEN